FIGLGGPVAPGLQSGGMITDKNNAVFADTILTGLTLNGPATITTSGTNELGFFRSITGAGPLTLVASNATIRLSFPNTYTGATIVGTGGGDLEISNPGAIPMTSALRVNVGGTIFFDTSSTIGSLAGAGTVILGNFPTNTLTTGGDNTSTTFSGVIQNSR